MCLVRMLIEADIRQLYQQPEVGRVLRRYRPWVSDEPTSVENAVMRLNWLRQLDPPIEIECLVLHRSSRLPLGFLCLSSIDPLNAKAELSVAFFRGLGTRCVLESMHWALETVFSSVQTEKLVFYVLPENQQAQRMLNAMEVPLESVLQREIVSQNGQRADLWRYALFRERWLKGDARRRLHRLVPLKLD